MTKWMTATKWRLASAIVLVAALTLNMAPAGATNAQDLDDIEELTRISTLKMLAINDWIEIHIEDPDRVPKGMIVDLTEDVSNHASNARDIASRMDRNGAQWTAASNATRWAELSRLLAATLCSSWADALVSRVDESITLGLVPSFEPMTLGSDVKQFMHTIVDGPTTTFPSGISLYETDHIVLLCGFPDGERWNPPSVPFCRDLNWFQRLYTICKKDS